MMKMGADASRPYGQYSYPRRAFIANYSLHTGLAFLRKGQDDFARRYFDFAIGVVTEKLSPFPNDAALLGERCWIRAVINAGLEEAFQDCERATLGKPDDSELFRNKGFVLFRQGKYPDALATLDSSVRLGGRDAYALFLRSAVKQKLGDASADVWAMPLASRARLSSCDCVGHVARPTNQNDFWVTFGALKPIPT